LVAALAVGACFGADRGLTGPGAPEMEAPMPSFAYAFTGCLAWSCTTGNCPNDPLVWGACCLEVDPDPEAPGIPRPSCNGTSYCEQYPDRCNGDTGPAPGLAAPYCFNMQVGRCT